MANSSPPAARTLDTVRPGAPTSAVRVKRAAKAPSVRPAPQLSVVERHAVSPHTCASLECAHDHAAEYFVPTQVGPLAVAVSLCRACTDRLPASVRRVPIEKGRG